MASFLASTIEQENSPSDQQSARLNRAIPIVVLRQKVEGRIYLYILYNNGSKQWRWVGCDNLAAADRLEGSLNPWRIRRCS